VKSKPGQPLLLAAWSILLFVLSACGNDAPQVNEADVVARVGEAVLTLDDLAAEIPEGIRGKITKEDLQDYISRWINSQILYQEAKRRGIDHEIDLARELERVERELVVNALLEKEIYADKSQVPEGELQKYYEANRESFRRSENEARVYHINMSTKAAADSLYRILRSGQDFAKVAQELAAQSEDPDSWDLTLGISEVPEAMHSVFRLRAGTVSAPIELDDGFHLFQVVEAYASGTLREVNMVRNEIANRLQASNRDERYRSLLAELRGATKVETKLEQLESMPMDSLFARAARKAQSK